MRVSPQEQWFSLVNTATNDLQSSYQATTATKALTSSPPACQYLAKSPICQTQPEARGQWSLQMLSLKVNFLGQMERGSRGANEAGVYRASLAHPMLRVIIGAKTWMSFGFVFVFFNGDYSQVEVLRQDKAWWPNSRTD